MNNNEKPVAIVTGASSGIGLGITQALLDRGYRVVGTSRSISNSKELKPSPDLVLVDGIKVVSDQGWALVVPDPADPVTHVWAEGSDLASSEALAATYVERITRMLP